MKREADKMSNESFYLDCHLKPLKFLVRYSGMCLESRRRNRTDKIKDRCIYILNILWLNFDVFGAVVWFVDGLAKGKSFVALSQIAPCIVFSFLANVKGYFYVRREDEVNDLIDNLKKLETKIHARKKNCEEELILKEETNLLGIVIKTLNVINVILLLTFALSPLILITYGYLKTRQLNLILPFLVLYPFDSEDLRIWPFVYLHQIWSEIIVMLNVCISDYFFYICCTFIKFQFRLIHYRVVNVITDGSDDNSLLQIRETLVDFIKWHQELIRLANVLDSVYTGATIYNFLCSSVLICLTGFNVLAMEDVAYSITFLVFLSSNLIQIFLLCFFGDMLMRSSIEIGDAVYKSKWYQANPTITKTLLLMHTRAQKPCKLTASGFADVNLLAFTKILSTAWSYFALLKTMYSSART